MEERTEIETLVDNISFGYYDEEGDEFREVEPTSEFERATVDSFETLKYAVREELLEMNTRVSELEDRKHDRP